MDRMVQCVKIGRELPGLAKPPFAGELGQRIYEHVSQQAWALWPAQATVIINHYGMSMADPRAQQILMQQMEEFFFGEEAQLPEGWTPEQQRTKGGPRRK
jgi:Fe-S cluster biosynthesis and repair protein YggX